MALSPAKTFCKCLRVAMLATGADLGAAADGVPRGVGPFDVRAITQKGLTVFAQSDNLDGLSHYNHISPFIRPAVFVPRLTAVEVGSRFWMFRL